MLALLCARLMVSASGLALPAESPCAQQSTLDSCNKQSSCYFNPTTETCVQKPTTDSCSAKAQADCTGDCSWTNGACVATGCAKFPTKASCDASGECMTTSDGICVKRLCGYVSKADCLDDDKCQFSDNTCKPNTCIAEPNENACKAVAGCEYTASLVPACQAIACPYNEAIFCDADRRCEWNNATGKCLRNTCETNFLEGDCTNAGCAWNTDLGSCRKRQCSATTESSCVADTKCVWRPTTVAGVSGSECASKDIDALIGAAAQSQASPTDEACEVIEKNMLPLGILLLVLAILLTLSFIWMYMRQKARLAAMGNKSGPGFHWGEDDEDGFGAGNERSAELQDKLVENGAPKHSRTDSL